MSQKPLWISIEAIDGAGKSTLIKYLLEYFKEKEVDCCQKSMFPSGPLREALLSKTPVSKFQELLITKALHEQAYSEIYTELSQGRMVLSDRGPDSMLAYQGGGTGLTEMIEKIDAISPPTMTPDLVIFIDATPEVCHARIEARNETRDEFELRDVGFTKRVYRTFKELCQKDEERVASGEQRYPRYYVFDGNLNEKQLASAVKLQLDFILED